MLRDFQAIIKLIDDTTPEVQTQIRKKIQEFYFALPPEQWQEFINSQPRNIQVQLTELYRNMNKRFLPFFINLWTGQPRDKDYELIYSLETSGIKVFYDNSLVFLLYLVSRQLTTFLSFDKFKSYFDALLIKFPHGYVRNNTALEQARYFVWLFYKWDRFYWTMEDPLWVSFDPYMTLRNRKGTGFTIALIMASVAQQLGLDWFLVSDQGLRASYLAVPIDRAWTLQPLLINTTTGVILNQTPQIIGENLIKFLHISDHRLVSAYYFLSAYLRHQFLPSDLHKIIEKIVFSLQKKIQAKY